uniref:Uncharacterized protein n=1 Tax=Glossina pallidipes TaxID=7398 RepID=A0A1B0ABE9_GLOPL
MPNLKKIPLVPRLESQVFGSPETEISNTFPSLQEMNKNFQILGENIHIKSQTGAFHNRALRHLLLGESPVLRADDALFLRKHQIVTSSPQDVMFGLYATILESPKGCCIKLITDRLLILLMLSWKHNQRKAAITIRVGEQFNVLRKKFKRARIHRDVGFRDDSRGSNMPFLRLRRFRH